MSAFVIISPRAQKQIEDIDSEIQSRSQERADEFLEVLNAKVEQLCQFPQSGAVHRGKVRRLLLLRFPYSLFYVFNDAQNTVSIISCFHDQSDPETWLGVKS